MCVCVHVCEREEGRPAPIPLPPAFSLLCFAHFSLPLPSLSPPLYFPSIPAPPPVLFPPFYCVSRSFPPHPPVWCGCVRAYVIWMCVRVCGVWVWACVVWQGARKDDWGVFMGFTHTLHMHKTCGLYHCIHHTPTCVDTTYQHVWDTTHQHV